MTAKLTKTMADAIEAAVNAKVEATRQQLREYEYAMAGIRAANRDLTEMVETLQNRHTLAMHIIADKSNTIRILTVDCAQMRAEVNHYKSECARFEKARNYWRDRYAYMSKQFFKMLNRLADWETYLGIMPRKDSWDFSEVEDYSQEN